jgi:hypothetical protein
MRCVFVLLISIGLWSCDPAYHLSYAVVNESRSTLYCIDSKGSFMQGKPFRIEPDSSVLVYEEAGFGSARAQFRSSKGEVVSRFRFYSDSSCVDSTQIQPRKQWKYHTLPKGDYNVRLYVRNSDFNQ